MRVNEKSIRYVWDLKYGDVAIRDELESERLGRDYCIM